mmetsp:Transcript_46205/g.143161  ORF Transcript_46205/g.143161 Transcript_46205/m.143161 type:complete len:89 (-) Transcript_46205:468-734(-)
MLWKQVLLSKQVLLLMPHPPDPSLTWGLPPVECGLRKVVSSIDTKETELGVVAVMVGDAQVLLRSFRRRGLSLEFLRSEPSDFSEHAS